MEPPTENELAWDREELDELEIIVPDPTKRRVFTESSDPTVKVLYDDYKSGYLVLQPDFQRYFVWDVAKSSRLIESVLMNVPLPVVYLAQESDGAATVIDGQQRLTSFFRFLDGDFALQGLKVLRELNGQHFQDLERVQQRTIQQCAIRAIKVLRESDPELRFEIFERLNTGSVALNDQELRNCVYRGPYNELIKEMASDLDFMYLLGLREPERRMRDVELALRFSAFYHATYLKYQPPMRRFLNRDMETHRLIEIHDAHELRKAFKSSCQIIRSLFDRHAFKRFYRGTEVDPNGYWEPRKFNTSLYDILMWGFTNYDKNQVYRNLDAVREALINLMTEDQQFIDSIELSTSSGRMVSQRFDKWRAALSEAIGQPSNEPRSFSLQLKQDLFEKNPTCAICSNRIQHLDDAAVDHIEQYWLGGRTVPENARLTHRFCNWSRPRKESQAVSFAGE